MRLRRSKTDQAGQDRSIAVVDGKLKIPAAVAAWLEDARIMEGAVFCGCDRGWLSAERIGVGHFARILKARWAAARLDPGEFGGHSPRRGLATYAEEERADLRLTAKHMRHVKLKTAAGYM